MRFFINSLGFIFLLMLHVELLVVFSLSYYTLYFFNLLVILYLLHFNFSNYLSNVFFLHVAISLVIINLNIYDEMIFETALYLNLLESIPYINSEVMYVLSLVHILLFINLKRFENIWAIIDKKFIRN